MPHVFLDGYAKPLLVLHALAAFALCGACTHQAIIGIGLLRGRLHLGRLARIYAQLIGALFIVAFGVGLLMYPHYRYHVRGLFLDRYEPWASNLFDMKENLLALGLPFAVCLFVLGRKFDPREEKVLIPFIAFASIALWALVAFGVVSGVVVTSVKGV
jgi:hypothetical protein